MSVVPDPAARRDVPEPLDVRIVPMRRRHLRSVLRIEAQVYPRPWSLGLFLSELSLRSSRVYVVARGGSTTLGYAGLMFAAAEGHVTNIAVDPAQQGRQIGTRLLLVLAREAVARGSTALTLEVRVSNARAQALYRRFGFSPAGVRRNYYTDTNEDAIVMWAHDIDQPAFAARLAAIEATVRGATIVEGLER